MKIKKFVRGGVMLASSLELNYTPDMDFNAQYGYFHGVVW